MDGVMYVQAGGGVVADSDPNAEYEETLQKARALRRAAEESWRFVWDLVGRSPTPTRPWRCARCAAAGP